MVVKALVIAVVTLILAIALFLYFQFRKLGYQIRDNQVYFVEFAPGGLEFEEKLVPEADANSFKILTGKYALDDKRVYFVGRIINGANPKTFQLIEVDPNRVEDAFSKDDQHVFKFSSPIKDADPATFEIIIKDDDVIFKDKNRFYTSEGNPK